MKIIETLVVDSPLLMAAIGSEMKVVSLSQTLQERIQNDASDLKLSALIETETCGIVEWNVADVLASKTFVQGISVTCGSDSTGHPSQARFCGGRPPLRDRVKRSLSSFGLKPVL